MNNILWILGKAGSGKTTLILNSLSKFKNVACLTFTNAAKENLKLRMNSINPNNTFIFKTLHSYFHIGLDDFKQNILIYGALKTLHSYIVIDEFSLIPLDVMNLIFYYAKEFTLTKFFIIGDILQLSAIDNNINFKLSYLEEFNNNFSKISYHSLSKILEHLLKSVWFLNEFKNGHKEILTSQYRNKSLNIENIELKHFEPSENTNYIACTKKILKEIGLLTNITSQTPTKEKEFKTIFGYVSKDEICLSYGKDSDIKPINLFIEPEELTPIRLLTVHKSQGMEFDNVNFILDDIEKFDISALYTGATRARNKITFSYLHNKDININLLISIFKELEEYIVTNINKH